MKVSLHPAPRHIRGQRGQRIRLDHFEHNLHWVWSIYLGPSFFFFAIPLTGRFFGLRPPRGKLPGRGLGPLQQQALRYDGVSGEAAGTK